MSLRFDPRNVIRPGTLNLPGAILMVTGRATGGKVRGTLPGSSSRRIAAGTKVTVTSGLIRGSKTAEEFADGIVYIASGLKTFLETGEGLAA